ncbi:hypothetical protein NT01EI_1183 [Edwardsiella ictaluri 93-146]|uniref:Uncharacterized protein n=1 Tax=Edwardsiella ictaluri (strain 93-146) TaxID=634503 RepID=C5BHP7_EDWI9|nr:hypothetical protein NT01EI_1183 [Edwardsiella ictaluri 93-146]
MAGGGYGGQYTRRGKRAPTRWPPRLGGSLFFHKSVIKMTHNCSG